MALGGIDKPAAEIVLRLRRRGSPQQVGDHEVLGAVLGGAPEGLGSRRVGRA